MRKPMLAIAAAMVAALAALLKPAQAGCWGWCVVPGTSHAFVYGPIYGPHFAYPAYSEYRFAFALAVGWTGGAGPYQGQCHQERFRSDQPHGR
jgi:hypothetical protein